MNVAIRRETHDDYAEIYELIKVAFATAEHSDGDEQDLANKLREGSSYIPELALVAELDGRLVGHIMFTDIMIGENPAIIVGPVAVLPDMQGKRIGEALMLEGHRIARSMGYGFSVLVGHTWYYPRFGYRPAGTFGITTHLDVPEENFMAYDLQETGTRVEGQVKYPEAWGLG